MTVRESIIALKYELRHCSVSDELVERIDQTLHELRGKYKEDKRFFSSEDILFLKSVNVFLKCLEAYVRCQDKIPTLQSIQDAFQAFHTARSSMDGGDEEIFSSLTQQIDTEYHALCQFLNTINTSIQEYSALQ